MSKYQNTKIAALNGEDELALLVTGSKKSWMYKLFSLFSASDIL